VTRWVCEKKLPKMVPKPFLSKLIHKQLWKKLPQNLAYICNISLNCQKQTIVQFAKILSNLVTLFSYHTDAKIW
jgi:hypothetical protein